MSDKRQKIQLKLAFDEDTKGEAWKASVEGPESFKAERETESPAIVERLMEEVCERGNCEQALKRVQSNKGSAGVDGMTVEQLPAYLKKHWPNIRERLSAGTYEPQPVLRVEIAKPDGGMRKLGIPTVVDRFIQQAVLQILQQRWDPTFSDHSYGFRPGRSAQQAVTKAQQYIAEGNGIVVDIDLEKFFGAPGEAGASSGCDSRPGKGKEPPHQESSLGFMEVTTWAKRRQSDVRAVTQVKRLSLVTQPEADKVENLEGNSRFPKRRGDRRLRRGLRAWHGGNRSDMEPGRSTAVLIG